MLQYNNLSNDIIISVSVCQAVVVLFVRCTAMPKKCASHLPYLRKIGALKRKKRVELNVEKRKRIVGKV